MTAEATVMPSGRTLLVRLADPSGNPDPARALLSDDEIQSIAIGSLPAGGAYTLSDGTTAGATIPVSLIPPSTYATWTKSDCVPGRAYRISQISDQGNEAAVFLVYDGEPRVDGSNVLATLTVQQARWPDGTPGTITDGTTPDGQPAVWHDLGPATGLIPTGATLTIRVAGPVSPFLGADAIRVQDLTTGVVDYIDDRDPRFVAVGNWIPLWASPQTGGFCWDNTERSGSGEGTANRLACDPAAIQAELQALPSIGAGNVIVTAGGADQTGPFRVQFTGELAGRAVDILTASDPGVVVSESSRGGQFPTISINGGAAIPLRSAIWANGAALLAYPLDQSSPAVRTLVFGQDNFARGAGWGYPVPGGYGAGYLGQSSTVGTGCVATWTFPGLKPGETFQVGATWPSDPTYSAGATWSVTDLAGNPLAGPFVLSQKADPAGLSFGGRPWTPLATVTTPADRGIAVVLTNGDGDPLVADGVILTRTSADRSIVITPSDRVTFSAPAGFASTASGPLPAIVDQPATNLSGAGGVVPFDDATRKTMGAGYNVTGALAGSPVPPYSNLCKNAQTGGDGMLATDALGNPSTFAKPTCDVVLIGFWQDGKGLGRGLPVYPGGDFAVKWTGSRADALQLVGGSATACIERPELATSVGNVHTRIFTLTESINYSPTVTLRWDNAAVGDGTYSNDATDIQVYPPGIDPANPPKFHPLLLAMLAGMKSLRFMDSLNTIGGGCVDFADYQVPGRFSYFMPVRVVDVQVESIAGYVGTDTYFDSTRNAILLVTTRTPHTLSDGQFASFANCGEVLFSDNSDSGNTRDMSIIGGLARVLSPTTLLVECDRNTGADSPRMVNTLNPINGRLTSTIGGAGGNGGMPLLDCIELCNLIGCDFWLNVCNSVSLECMDAIGDAVALHLNPGLKCRFEFCNEPWNTIGSRGHLCAMTAALVPGSYDDPYPGYVNRAGLCFGRLQARFAAANRAGDVLLVLGGQRADGATVDSILAAAQAYGVAYDEITVDGYFDPLVGFNNDGSLTATLDGLSTDQDVDMIEITAEFANPDAVAISGVVAKLQAAIAAGHAKPTARVSVYEGGFYNAAPPGITTNFYARSFAALRHPRVYGITSRMLQKDQDAGVDVFHYYALNIGLGYYMWNVCPGLQTRPGTGDPIADAANITDPLDLSVAKSEVAGAMLRWASLYDGTYVPPPPPPPPTRAPARWGRNRRRRAAA